VKDDRIDAKDILEFLRLKHLYEQGDRTHSMRADFNGDGKVDSDDLFLFLVVWSVVVP